MPRRRRRRRVGSRPDFKYFEPRRGKPTSEIALNVEEFEAIRLNDFENMNQEEAAQRMGISQPTFHRTLVSARNKIADAIVNGKALKIEGGSYELVGKGKKGKGGNSPRK